jgi:O-antigen ligase
MTAGTHPGPLARRAPALIVQFRERALGAVAFAAFASLCVGWLVGHGHARLALLALVAPAVGAFVLRQAHYGLLAGTALVVLVPYWYTVGAPQAGIPRVASILALSGLLAAIVSQSGTRFRPAALDLVVTAIVVVHVASWATTPQVPKSLQAVSIVIVPLGFYAAARLIGARGRWAIAWVLVVSGAVASLTLCYELFVAHRPLFVAEGSYLWNTSGGLIFRPGGVLGSPPAAATVLAITTLAGLPLLSRAGEKRRLGLWLLLALNVTGEAVTFTRAGLIALVAGVVAYLALARPPALPRIAVASIVTAVAFGFFALPRIEHAHWFQAGVLRQDNLGVRESYWRLAWPLITNSPGHLVLGHGINSLTIGRPELPGSPDPDLASAPLLLRIGPHNQYVRTAFEEGLIGLALALAWLGGTVVLGARRARGGASLADRILPAGFTAAVLSFMIVSLAGDSFRNPPSIALAGLLSGLIVTGARPGEEF